MTRFLLDTNVCIEYLRQRDASVIAAFNSHRPMDLLLSSVVVAELCYGASKSVAPAKNLQLVKHLTQVLSVLPFGKDAAVVYGEIRADLERRGVPIGPYDMMIAASALADGLTLVTHNTKEFERIAGLQISDWHS
ncbi:MAG: type II toxin-antitoxin system VapC family toxin [Planctomycetaceae bacterium]|nr:type II toxin-antitoxin system VapC family toxin [Planctomycetaceae bacterium]